MTTRTMDTGRRRASDLQQAEARLARPRVRVALAAKRAADVALALTLLVAVAPVLLVVLVLLGFGGDGLLERRTRLGRHGRPVRLTRFRPLPGGALGRGLERAGARELPLLFTVLHGRMSFVGPPVLAPGTDGTGPRRLMAPGLIGPAEDEADAYVEGWTLRGDARLLTARRPVHHSVSNSSS